MESTIINSADSENKDIKISTIEWILIVSFIFGGCFLGYHLAPGPKYWDDLLYLHTGWSMEANPLILNRYSTIYLLSFFNLLARGDPILGGRYFGAFISSVILVLVYFNARILAKTRQVFLGLFAVLFLLTFTEFTSDFGVVMADYTVTMMILVGILIFILYWRFGSQRKILLFLLGFIIFLSFKSKETGIILCLLIPSFFIDSGEPLTKRDILIKVGLIVSGCLLGFTLFILLNAIFLKDFLFGLRYSDLRELIGFNTNQMVNQQVITDNYLNYIAPSCMFLLSLIWVIKADDHFKLSNRWLWFSVLGIIPFLDLTCVNGGWPIVIRYLTPAVAILSILAPQIIQIENPFAAPRKNIYLLFIIAGSLIISAIIVGVLYLFVARRAGWGFTYFIVGVLSPIVVCILLFWLCFKRRNNIFSLVIIVTCIGALTAPMAAKNVLEIVSSRTKQDSRFLPFAEFKNGVVCSTGKILISGTIYQNYNILSRGVSSSQWMYDLYFRCHISGDQFDYGQTQEEIFKDLLLNSYDYVFLDDSDYHYLLNQKNQSQEIFNRYLVEVDSNHQFYLLSIQP